ncbi:MAG: L,D-transpeptidase, partial [Deltaproteobacteria bacterium]|nr:L,D-transpeptidase [Deltaproteobacteria bacterium]
VRASRELSPGFAVAVEAILPAGALGEPHARTSKGLFVPARELREASASSFRGRRVESGALDFAFVATNAARLREVPGARSRPLGEPLPRHATVAVDDSREVDGAVWHHVVGTGWGHSDDLRRPTRSPPPEEALPGERWIDVDLAAQLLVAYEGTEPVFATLVSTGRGAPGTETATPPGVHRIWVKLRSSDMTNLEVEDSRAHYSIEDVPWVMFFRDAYGLHGAFWHRSFGSRRSHGCVNLSPADAATLFQFARPTLPDGWSAVLPTTTEPGTLVRVR